MDSPTHAQIHITVYNHRQPDCSMPLQVTAGRGNKQTSTALDSENTESKYNGLMLTRITVFVTHIHSDRKGNLKQQNT